MPNALTSAGLSMLHQADRQAVVSTTAKLGRYLQHERWLGNNNQFQGDAAKRLDNTLKASGHLGSASDKHLSEYLAASIPVHAMDGWSYLGRSLAAHIACLPDIARHLAYYSELRAAMSLLASAGIGILNTRQFVMTSSGTLLQFERGGTNRAFKDGRAGTHVATWLCFDEWANTRDAADLLSSILSAEGVPLVNWLAGDPEFAQWNPIAASWLKDLGLDLSRLASDRDARNLSSYQPTTLYKNTVTPPDQVLRFIDDLWTVLEPSTPTFASLDLHFLRATAQLAFRAVRPSASSEQFRRAIERMVKSQAFPVSKERRLIEFLMPPDEPDQGIFARAKSQAPIDHPEHHLDVISRATILLRLATGSMRKTLSEAGLRGADLHFWWRSLTESRGMGSYDTLDDVADFWLDVSTSLQELSDWIANTPVLTHHGLVEDCGRDLARVTDVELVPVLGIAS